MKQFTSGEISKLLKVTKGTVLNYEELGMVRSGRNPENGYRYYSDLDLDELLTEDLLLDVPSKFLCSPDCKGLCPSCGKNLNHGDCDCQQDTVDPRLAILKELL